MRCDIVYIYIYRFSPILGVVVLLTSTYLFMSYVLVMVFGAGVSLEAAPLSPEMIEVRHAYILPSQDPINKFAIGGIILGMVVVVVVYKVIS
ncbi:hypothetical protein Hanom_Chr07g00619651 [Helianthus anomalus]